MFTQDHLQELLSVDVNGSGVISIYLDTDCSQQSAETIKLQVRGMLKELNGQYATDATIIEKFLDLSYDWTTPGLAMFSSAQSDYFQAYPIAVAFRNRLRIGSKPYVKPLAHLLDHYAYYGVVLVDRVGARFFEYHLGELQYTEGVMGEEVRKLKKGEDLLLLACVVVRVVLMVAVVMRKKSCSAICARQPMPQTVFLPINQFGAYF